MTGLYYYGMRYYAPWIARFISVDPLQFKYPIYTPYQYAGNKPISYIDLDGAEEYITIFDPKLVEDWQSKHVKSLKDVSNLLDTGRRFSKEYFSYKKAMKEQYPNAQFTYDHSKYNSPIHKAFSWVSPTGEGNYEESGVMQITGYDKEGTSVTLFESANLESVEKSNDKKRERLRNDQYSALWEYRDYMDGTYGWHHEGGKEFFFGVLGLVLGAGEIAAGVGSAYLLGITIAGMVNDADNIAGVFVGESDESLFISLANDKDTKLLITGAKGVVDIADLATDFYAIVTDINKFDKFMGAVQVVDDSNSLYLDYNTFKKIRDDK